MNYTYLIGTALFPAAIAQWALLRSRSKSGNYPLTKTRTLSLSMVMWAAGFASIIAMAILLAIAGFDAAAIDRSESWITLASGLFAYSAGRPLVGFWDKRGAYMAPAATPKG